MIKKIIAISLAMGMPTAALADNIGFRVGGYSWNQNFEGDVKDGPDTIDLDKELGLDDESNNVFFFALEHPIPILPNILLQQTQMEVDGSSTASFEFNGETFTGDINTNLDLTHTDATLYYEVLDNWVNLDLGLTIRKFDGSIDINTIDGLTSTSEDIDDAIPMLYIAAKFDLPLTGLYIGASGNGLAVGDASLTDLQVNLGYETSFGLGIEVGARSFDLEYEDKAEEINTTVDGSYISLFYHF